MEIAAEVVVEIAVEVDILDKFVNAVAAVYSASRSLLEVALRLVSRREFFLPMYKG